MREYLITGALLVFAFLTFAFILKTCYESDKKKALKKFLITLISFSIFLYILIVYGIPELIIKILTPYIG